MSPDGSEQENGVSRSRSASLSENHSPSPSLNDSAEISKSNSSLSSIHESAKSPDQVDNSKVQDDDDTIKSPSRIRPTKSVSKSCSPTPNVDVDTRSEHSYSHLLSPSNKKKSCSRPQIHSSSKSGSKNRSISRGNNLCSFQFYNFFFQFLSCLSTPNETATKMDIKMDSELLSTLSTDDDSVNGTQKRRFLRQPIPKKIKRLRRNRRLRKILTPKNALRSLHELLGTGLSEFSILPEEHGFVATVYINNAQYEGRGMFNLYFFSF